MLRVKALESTAWSDYSYSEYKHCDLLQVTAPKCLCFFISKLWAMIMGLRCGLNK